MTGIKDYSTTALNNTTVGGISIAEGMLPSNINNAFRAITADIREWYNDSQWVIYGDGDSTFTIAYGSATTFTVASADVTTFYHVGRRVKAIAATPGTIYGTISATAFSTNTTVTVVWDSGSLSNEAVTIYVSVLSATNNSIPEGVVSTAVLANGSVTTAKLAADAVDGTKIADDSIDSEHYVDGSIDTQHIADSQITTAKLATDSVTTVKVADLNITTAKIADSNITTAKINNDAVTADKIADAVIVTNAEASGHTPNDTTFFTTSASDGRYFRQDSSETIASGDTWSGSDSYIATTAAIDARIIDLVDDVGGFIAIANEDSFPTTNPDINDDAGTIVSIADAGGMTYNTGTGVSTDAQTTGAATVTINSIPAGIGSPIPNGYGMLVETTSTLNTYTFHRLVPIATEVTTVASISGNITTVANDETDIGVVAGLSTDIQTLADIEDGTTATNTISNVGNNIADVTTIATNIANVNTVAGNNTNINTVAGNNANITTVAGANANVTTVAGSIANVNEVANNIGTVNNFGERYRVQAGEPSVNNDEGDLVYDTTANAVKVYNGTSFDTIQQGITDVAPTRHSIRPSLNLDFANSKVLDPRITFTRASNATYYDGYTSVKAEENLLKYSQEFDNAYWTKNGTTVTANDTTAPDGTTTAETMTTTASGTANNIYASIGNIDGDYAYSIYLKANTSNFGFIGHYNGSVYHGIVVDLSTGTITDTSGTLSSTNVTDAGNGWYRLECVKNFNTSSGYLLISLSDSGTPTYSSGRPSFTGVSESIYIWGAQVEQRDTVTAYTPTTTQPITNYIPVLQTAGNNVARFDHNPDTGESLGLLIEESRTNVAQYSEQPDNAYWTKSNASVEANVIIAPDGNLTGDKLIADTNNDSHFFGDTRGAWTNNAYYTISIYAKAGEYSNFQHIRGSVYDLTNGTVVSTGGSNASYDNISASIEDVGNGWYRCKESFRRIGATISNGDRRFTIHNGSSTVFTGNNYKGIYVWGVQVEAGAFPTSYIPTVASQVTRSADNAVMTGTNFTSWYNYNGGSLYGECIQPASSGAASSTLAFITESNSQIERIELRARNAGTASRAYINTQNSNQCDFNLSTVAEGNLNKMIIAFTYNDFAATNNGATVQTDNVGRILDLFVRLNIGSTGVGVFLNSTIKKIAYYPLRLTNNELVDLTEE